MAETGNSGGATPWIAFLLGVVAAALLGVGYFAYTNSAADRTAQLDLNVQAPQINPPVVDLPRSSPPMVQPPRADGAP